MTEAYFLTVDWCNKGNRGVFCNGGGHCFRKDGEPHTALEMQDILGPFWLVLAPQSESFTKEQLAEYSQFVPLAEYSYQFGVAMREAA